MYGQQPPQQQWGYRQAPLPEQPRTVWWPRIIAWVMLALGGLLIVGTGVAAYGSESAGMTMSYLTIGPFLFGLVATVVGHATRYRQLPTHAGATLGCGGAAALFGLVGLVLFFAVIWRML